MFLRNIARNQLIAGQTYQAEKTIDAALRVSTAEEKLLQVGPLAAQAALQRGRTVEAGRLLDRAFAGVDLTATAMSFHDSHEIAVEAYRSLRQYDKALAHLTALKRLDDQATRLATQTSNALMGARFDAANQAARIARLRDAERLRVARDALRQAETARLISYGGAAAIALIGLLLFLNLLTIRRSRDELRVAHDDLAVTNDALGEALGAKTEFLASTSHEIRTPLNGILGMTQVLLADEGLPEPTRDRLEVIHDAGLTMRALVDDILDVAKMETGNLGLEAAPFDLAALLDTAGVMWAEQARAKGIGFVIDMADCPTWVEGDPGRVRQIVFNLLSNAIKFTREGAITIAASRSDAGVRIAVTDTGIGIAADKLEQVFEPFRQADASTTRRFGGTGLGLTICRSLARAMGGEMALASRPGEGSTFSLTLPLPATAAPPEPVAPDADATLLVIDRNPITRAMFRALFQPLAGAVAFAATAAEATARLKVGGIERVLIDDGTVRAAGDPHRFVMAITAAAGAAPVVLLWPDAAEAATFERLGVSAVVAKPVTGAALTAALFEAQKSGRMPPPLVSQAA